MCASWKAENSWMKSSAVIIVLCALNCVNGQESTHLFGENVILPCVPTEITPGETFTWSDTETDITIYIVGAPGVVNKQFAAANDVKYDNFDIDNQYPDSVNLKIDAIDLNDGGKYRCALGTQATPPDAVVKVEATPLSVSVSCTRNQANCPQTVGNSDEFICTCNAVGAYPDTLELSWSNVEGDPATDPPTSSTQRPGAYDFTSTATFIPTETKRIATCTVVRYNGSWDVEEGNYPTVPPGKCDISISCNDKATVATLTCSCPSGVPEDTIYTYYDENGAVVTSEVSVTPGVQFTVGCRACNGVNYGEDTFVSKNETCTVTTVTVPTTTTDKNGTATDPTGAPVALIASLSVCGVILIIVVIIGVIWFLKNRDGDSDKNKPDPPQNDDAVITMNASTTSSLAPLYGEVKKDKKKKSDDSVNDFGNKETPAVYAVPDKNKKRPPQPTAAPRTSQNVPDDQPMQELQYADLDHGKQPPTNEIRKPQDEPTEYATVQSVIV